MRVVKPKTLVGSHQELKEAVCDAIVNLTTDSVSGKGESGATVYGRSPKRAFVAGLLLPRFDEQGNEDETSDIRISTLGIDLEIVTAATGQAELRPEFSTYVRVFPTWEELNDLRYGLEIDFQLDPVIEQQITATIRSERAAKFQAEGLDQLDPKDMPPDQRQRRQSRRAEIRWEVTRAAYASFNIELDDEDAQPSTDEFHKTPLDSTSETNTDPSEHRKSGSDDSANVDPAARRDTPVVPITKLLRRGRQVPHNLLRSGEIPNKWRCLTPELPPFKLDLALSPSQLTSEVERYSADLRAAATAYVQRWFQSDDGQENTVRDVPVMPADIASKEAWDEFLKRARSTTPPYPQLIPALDGVNVQIDKLQDYANPTHSNLRVTLENDNRELSSRMNRRRLDTLFQASLSLTLPAAVHQFLQLDRVEPSYRFRHHMAYPAMGLNCGVASEIVADNITFKTTWAPRFVQPRIVPPELSGVPFKFAELADPNTPCSRLHILADEYGKWISTQEPRLRQEVRLGIASVADADAESNRLETDLDGQRKEARYIERGVQLLVAAQAAAQRALDETNPTTKQKLELEAIPWRAWLLMNRTFLNRDGGDAARGWRLFQLAFVLAHLPTFVSRMPEFKDWHDPELDESSASLLYFPTGGGKSEAFYGSLLFAMFLDRIRGKDRGVTAMIRYPLRLLTLQQAQRLLKLLVQAELIRVHEKIGNWPFEIGFWVGKTNTPNRFAEVSAKIPSDDDSEHPNDSGLIPVPQTGTDELVDQARTYEESQLGYNKIPSCPVCGQATGLRRVLSEGNTARRLAIYCFNSQCDWNSAHKNKTPLPFLLTDDAVYQRAPSVVLGTVDKMAMLGQSTETISQLLGMFGLARWIGPTGHLQTPRGDRLRTGPVDDSYETVFPSYLNGKKVFHDPFPALIIQDEAHLLEESLGTFSGLFETLFELVMSRIYDISGAELEVARCWHGTQWGPPRTPKIIAATATVSDPERQLEVLYQRQPLRFPYPGPDIYHSFFAEPAPIPPSNQDRAALEQSLPMAARPEATAPWMRLYVSLMTNGATHTMTAVTVLSAFHLVITNLWRRINDPARRAEGLAHLRAGISSGRDGDWRLAAFDAAIAAGEEDIILALVDLHRIGLTYVTNKKGGDQIMDALDLQVKREHFAAGHEVGAFDCRLISGGIDMQTIQQIMTEAERDFPEGSDFPDLGTLIRSVVATSAISHGVDVDRFNSMFFAGLPSDVAEYIQASSRVGRAHVGFVMLIPTPQSRRDRYVVETHDIFHRFLERMISPPAAQRWAANALKRVTASMIQAWAMLKEAEAFKAVPDSDKADAPRFDVVHRLHTLAANDGLAMRNELGEFMLRGIGFPGRGTLGVGQPVYADVYRDLVDKSMKDFVSNIATFNSQIRLGEFWAQNSGIQAPMTSLRDVDEAGLIVPSNFDPRGPGGTRRVRQEAFVAVMKAIRSQRGTAAETDREAETEPTEAAT